FDPFADTLVESARLEAGPSGPPAEEEFHWLAPAPGADGLVVYDLDDRRQRSRTVRHRASLLRRASSTRKTTGPNPARIQESAGQSAAAGRIRFVGRGSPLSVPDLSPLLAQPRLCGHGLRRLAAGMSAQRRTGKTLGLRRQEGLGTDAVH